MDFIEHDVVAASNSSSSSAAAAAATNAAAAAAAAAAATDVNLDAFDVFNEFPDLDNPYGGGMNPQAKMTPHGMQQGGGGGHHLGGGHHTKEHLAHVTEYSPDWAWSDVSRMIKAICHSLSLKGYTRQPEKVCNQSVSATFSPCLSHRVCVKWTFPPLLRTDLTYMIHAMLSSPYK